MAKRHKHYSGKKKKGNNGASQEKVNHKVKHRRNKSPGTKTYPNSSDAWHNSSVPMGDDDLMLGANHTVGDINRGRAYISPDTIEDYYFGRNKFKNDHSLKFAGLRRHEREQNGSSASLNNFRQNKMVFVKAKEAYDPSHDMIEKLRAKEQSCLKDEHPLSVELVTAKEIAESDDDGKAPIDIADIYVQKSDDNDDSEENNNIVEVKIEDQASKTSSSSSSVISDKDLFFVDEDGYTDVTPSTVRTVFTDDVHTNSKPQKSNLEFQPTLTIGKVELDVKPSNNDSRDIVVESRPRAHPFSGYIKNVMHNLNEDSDSEGFSEFEDEIDIEYEQSDDEGYMEDLKRAISPLSFPDDEKDEEHLQPTQHGIAESIETFELSETEAISSNEHIVEPADPEFGFLEDDYVINTAEVRVSNIRLGYNENSYYVQSYRLFGDNDSRWIEQELFDDYIVNDLGLPEHRLQSYLKHVKDALIPKEETPEPTLSDIQFSDTSEEEDDDLDYSDGGIPDDMMEGLDDLVSYSLQYNNTRNQEFETHALRTIGKGKKKKLIVSEDMQLDGETISTLQDKLKTRSTLKANKRRNKEDFIFEENKNSRDLLKKYPYGLHVENIRDELEAFLTYETDSLSFPALDPHGNKTVAKFATHYNMKTKKTGRGNKQHIIVQKTKKTRRGLPNYNLIFQLLRQRPVFMRIDVSRTSATHVDGRVIRERVTSNAKFNFKEGELVGEDAPEIGKENIGRKLLEKLGWSSGEGLGAHGNKGISEPVLAVVKKSKTGLGHNHGDANTQGEEISDSNKRIRHGHKHNRSRKSRLR
ncbi:protein Sqs1p [Monosporozyma servazzii]